MSALEDVTFDLVTANHILAVEGIVDAFGHVSARHPDRPDRYLLSCSNSPETIQLGDIMEFELDGTPVDARGRKPYLERFIHGAIYEARPDVQAVVHSHSRSVIPYTVTGEKLRPIVHSSATIGAEIPTWDAQDKFGDTALLISDMAMGRDFAGVMAGNSCGLMRGHGSTVASQSLRGVIYTAYYLEANADLQMKASQFGKIKFLTPGEVAKISSRLNDGKPGEGYSRAWDYWCRRAGLPSRRP